MVMAYTHLGQEIRYFLMLTPRTAQKYWSNYQLVFYRLFPIHWINNITIVLLIIVFLMQALYQDLAKRQDWLVAHHQNAQDIRASVDGYQ